MKVPAVLLAACTLASLQACDAPPRVASATVEQAPHRVIDSILPIEEQLRRVRTGLPRVDSLSLGAASRDALVREVIRAAEASDTAALNRLLITPAEFAWVYYPDHAYARPPYELDPRTFWTLIQGGNEKGLARLLKHRAGHPLDFRGYRCEASAAVRAPLREWKQCYVTVRVEGQRKDELLFGSIIEADGRYKLVSFANQF